MGIDGRPIRGSKYVANGPKNTGSSSTASIATNSAGHTSSSDGTIASHNVDCSLAILRTMAWNQPHLRVRGHPPCLVPSRPGINAPTFQVLARNLGHQFPSSAAKFAAAG